jgi:hypothetical protein
VAGPNGVTIGGLLTSLQILCHGGQEAPALRIARAYEQATSRKSAGAPKP